MTRILTVIGARPQFVKAGALTRAISARSGVTEVLVHTGQHFDPSMSQVFFDELAIPAPAYNLDIHGGGHGSMTGRMLLALEPIVEKEQPDWLLVYGDTNSTLAGALAAAKLNIPVAHVEAGLRSFNRRMPEEINRVMTDHVSTALFCPTQTSVENLSREGITRGVHFSGDVMYDATLFAAEQAKMSSKILEQLGLEEGRYAVATVHRAENTETPEELGKIVSWLRGAAQRLPVVLPLHPRTKAAAARFGLSLDGLKTVVPLGYIDMTSLVAHSAEVYTDSGGLQKEAYFHRKPCVTLRSETEWVETIEAGWNRLWSEPTYRSRRDIPDYGDGRTAERILDMLTA